MFNSSLNPDTQHKAAASRHMLGACQFGVKCKGSLVITQQEFCAKVQSEYVSCDGSEKLGIAFETLGKLPINGLRIKPENGTCGWYIWCGEEFSEDADFFKPLHVAHLPNYLPRLEKFLGLAPGHRFLIAGEYEDVWYDQSLINI